MHEEMRERWSSGPRRLVGLVGGLLLLVGMPGHATASDNAEVSTSIEAWYRGSLVPPDHPLCVVGCPPVSFPEAPAPDDTLHVGVAGGFETARTYIVLDLSALPPGRVVTGGTVRLPLAGVEDGTTAPELADLVACAVHGIVEPADGGPADQAPAIGCERTAPAELDPDGDAFTFALEPFATGLPSSDELAVALVASEDARGQGGGTWRAVFHGRERQAPGAEPITALVRFATDEVAAAPPPPAPGPPPAPSVGLAERLTPAAPQTGQAPALPGPADPDPEPPPAAAPAEGPDSPTVEPMAAPLAGYAYPQVWLLPLVFLAAGGVLTRSLALTYEVAPPSAQPPGAASPR